MNPRERLRDGEARNRPSYRTRSCLLTRTAQVNDGGRGMSLGAKVPQPRARQHEGAAVHSSAPRADYLTSLRETYAPEPTDNLLYGLAVGIGVGVLVLHWVMA